MREQLFNDGWLFWEDKDAFALIWDVPEAARPVRLPHDPMIEKDARPDSPGGNDGGYRDGGSFVYYRTLDVPKSWRERTVYLRFDGAGGHVTVYVNGQRAALVPYGYTTFYVPLNDYLLYGQENQLRVQTRTGDMPNARWYTGGGLCRDVYLAEGGLVHVPPQGVRVSTASLEDGLALVKVETELKNRDAVPRTVTVRTELLDPDGELAARDEQTLTLFGGGAETLAQTVPVERPRLWSEESPMLYTCRTMVTSEDGQDSTQTTFGIRTLTLDARRGLRVNGKSVKLRGACIHSDSGLLGAATYAEAEHRRIRLLKEAGFNAIRSAHNPLAPVTLEACDRLGVYVMDEAFDMWTRSKKDYDYSQFFDKWWSDDLTAMVKKDINHPSVIFYSLGNEIPEVATPYGSAVQRKMAALVRSLDPTRYVMSGVNGVFATGDRLGDILADVQGSAGGAGGGNVNNFMAATIDHEDEIVTHPILSRHLELAAAGMDLVGYNYMTARYEPDAKAYPNRVIVGSETYPPQIARNWEIIARSGNVVGDFTWTGWDYLGEVGIGVPAYRFGEGGFGAQYPCQLAYTGDIDIIGVRRPASYFRQIVFGLRREPYIAVQEPAHYGERPIQTPWVLSDSRGCWTHPGFEGKPVVIEVYAPGDEVELILNGASLGRRAAGPAAGFRTLFETVYEPGTLEAVAYENGAELSRYSLSTAREGTAALHVDIEPGEGLPDRKLIYADISVQDGSGTVLPVCAGLTAAATGDGELAALGSGDPKPLTGYVDGVSALFYGRALAVIRTAKDHGRVILTVTAEGFEPAERQIEY